MVTTFDRSPPQIAPFASSILMALARYWPERSGMSARKFPCCPVDVVALQRQLPALHRLMTTGTCCWQAE